MKTRTGGRGARPIVALVTAGLIAVPAITTAGQAKGKKPDVVVTPVRYEELYHRYLMSARQAESTGGDQSIAWMTDLALDARARRVNDLVTIRVVESIAAVGTADSSLSKASSASAALPKFFGVESKLPSLIDPGSLASTSADSSFKGGGSTTRSGELTAVITARVAEVLPNGDLVLEGAREIEINGDRQLLVLTGVARPADITPDNVIASTRVGQLSIRYFGRGLMKDNLKPGWLVRILNLIF